MNRYVPAQYRQLPDPAGNVSDPAGDGEHVDSGSIRADRLRTREGSALVGHRTRESFIRAVSQGRPGEIEPAPIPPGVSAAEARAALRAIYCRTGGDE